MKQYKQLVIIAISILFFGCKNTDDKIKSYIEGNCQLGSSDSCIINLKDVLSVDFDTMYIFGEYTQLEELRSILNIPYYNKEQIEDSHFRIILLNKREIVYEDDFPQIYSHFSQEKHDRNNGNEISFYYCMYTSPFFIVKKKMYDEGYYYKYYYYLTYSIK